MIETIGIVLALIGLVFAFETPRRRFIALFKRSSAIEHDFKIHTVFHGHNEGKPIGPLGTNKTEKQYVLRWTITNKTDRVIQLEEGLVMRQRDRSKPMITLGLPQISSIPSLHPNHRHEVLSLQLTPAEVDHYRHWTRECDAFGLKETTGEIHWIPTPLYERFATQLQAVAEALGLPKAVPPGRPIVLQVNRTPPPAERES
jgi:hypothetical protein